MRNKLAMSMFLTEEGSNDVLVGRQPSAKQESY
jgi:hypothetical protein